MWIERLDIHGFKRLSDSYPFAKGLTLVVGVNESGKSSLHEALVRALFGYSSSELRKSHGLSIRDRRRPWNGNAYGIVALLHDRDSRSLRVEWDFDAPAVSVFDAVTGARLGSEAPGRNLLGLDLDDFRQVCCLTQDQITGVSGTATLKNALEQAIMSAGGDVRADQAEERMKKFLQRLGVRVDTYKPTPTGTLRNCETRRDKLVTRLDKVESESEEIAALARELAAEQLRVDHLRDQQRALRREQMLTEAGSLETRLGEARRHAEAAEKRPATPIVVAESLLDRITGLEAQLDALNEPIERLEREVASGAENLAELEGKERLLNAEVDGLSAYAGTDPSHEAAARDIRTELQTLSAPVAPEIEDAAGAAQPAPRPPSLWGHVRHVLWLALVVLSLGLAALIRRWLRERRRRLTQHAVESALERQRGLTAARKDKLERELTAILGQVGVPTTGGIEERTQTYLVACEKHREWERKRLELVELQRELGDAREPARSLRDRRAERDRLQTELLGTYEELGVAGLGYEEARNAASTVRAQAARDAEAIATADGAKKALDAALAGMTVEALESAAERARRAYDEHVAAYGTLPPPEGEASLPKIETEVDVAQRRVAQLETQITDREQALPPAAELREELDECVVWIERIEQAKEAVRIARETLAQAAAETYRSFAPHLNAALEANLPRITGGRYRTATVDESLDIRVVAPETDSQVSVDELSRATQDQIFLVQRLEIARLLDPSTGSAPLLLDDPFAHYDRDRLRFALQLLGEIAETRQVIVFSEDDQLPAIATEICGGCHVIELERPEPSGADQ